MSALHPGLRRGRPGGAAESTPRLPNTQGLQVGDSPVLPLPSRSERPSRPELCAFPQGISLPAPGPSFPPLPLQPCFRPPAGLILDAASSRKTSWTQVAARCPYCVLPESLPPRQPPKPPVQSSASPSPVRPWRYRDACHLRGWIKCDINSPDSAWSVLPPRG